MGKNSGQIVRMTDGRMGVIRHDQPLLKDHKKIVIYLIDDEFAPVMKDDKWATLVKGLEAYQDESRSWTGIGMWD